MLPAEARLLRWVFPKINLLILLCQSYEHYVVLLVNLLLFVR